MDVKFLEKLSNADALAGREDEVRQLMLKELKPLSDNVFTDNIGSIVFEKKGNAEGPKILVAAHMDEVGFIVRSITDQGQIIVKTNGGVKNLGKFMQAVRITTASGKKINGFVQSTYTEDKDSKEIPGKTYVDLGLNSASEVKKLGIEVGDMICFDSNFKWMSNKNLVMGKAFDDRLGCYIMARVLDNLKSKKHPNTIYFAATSSEETGIRGAGTVSRLVKPDLGIVVDACCYKDEFDRSSANCRQIGKGMSLTHNDKGYEANQKFYNFTIKTAKKLKKNIQYDMFDRGTTDAANIYISGSGVPTQACCIPLRYGHCSYSIANLNDIEDTIEIITDMLCKIDSKIAKDFVTFI